MREAERRLAEERARARAYLEPRTEAALVEVVVAGLLEPHLADCMADEQTGLRHMLDALDIDSQSPQQHQNTITPHSAALLVCSVNHMLHCCTHNAHSCLVSSYTLLTAAALRRLYGLCGHVLGGIATLGQIMEAHLRVGGLVTS